MDMPLDSIDDPGHLYFITASIINWTPLFKEDKYAKVILDVLSFFRNKKEILLFAFVIMPSHVHLIIKPINIPIGKFLQSFGSLTAHKIIRILRDEKRSDILNTFHENRRDRRSNYSFWQEIFTENIFTQKFLEQKFEYLHQNPVPRAEDTISDRTSYSYSSAGYYDKGENPIIEIDDIRDYLMQ
jgi:putative transposase